jgi:hypothetical protein
LGQKSQRQATMIAALPMAWQARRMRNRKPAYLMATSAQVQLLKENRKAENGDGQLGLYGDIAELMESCLYGTKREERRAFSE